MKIRFGIAGAALVLFSLACSSGSNGPSLTISPPSLTVTSGSTPAGFTATETGATNAISWSLAGPGSISNASGTTTSYTAPTSLASSTTATLTATAGTLTANATITINPPAVNLTISPPSLTVAAGRSSTPFTATETGASNPIAWSLSGPGTISSMTGAMTDYTPPLGISSQTTATLTATAGALTANAVITITVPTPISVTGTIVADNNVPMSGVAVTIGAQNTLTDVSGQFTIANVMPPYDVIAILNKVAVVYQQLTLPTPTIVFFNPSVSPPTIPNTGTVTGSVSPSNLLGASGYDTIVAWGSPQTRIYAGSTAFSSNPYSLPVNWVSPLSITGNVHVIQYAVDAGFPASYPNYGMTQGVTVMSGGTPSAPTINMTSVAVGALTARLTLPTGYGLAGTIMNVEFADGATLLLQGSISSPPWPATWATPLGIDGTIDLEALGVDTTNNALSGTMVSGLSPSATDAGVTVQVASTPALPSNTAMNITTASNFSWTPFAGGVNCVVFIPSSPANPTYVVFTSATTVTIPNLSTEGLGLPSGGQSYSWRVYGFAPFANVDVFASQNSLAPLSSAVFGIIVLKPLNGFPQYSYSLGATRSFTTQ